MEHFIKRIQRMEDFSKLYGELKHINRIISEDSTINEEDLEELKEKKKIIEARMNELMFVTL